MAESRSDRRVSIRIMLAAAAVGRDLADDLRLCRGRSDYAQIPQLLSDDDYESGGRPSSRPRRGRSRQHLCLAEPGGVG